MPSLWPSEQVSLKPPCPGLQQALAFLCLQSMLWPRQALETAQGGTREMGGLFAVELCVQQGVHIES